MFVLKPMTDLHHTSQRRKSQEAQFRISTTQVRPSHRGEVPPVPGGTVEDQYYSGYPPTIRNLLPSDLNDRGLRSSGIALHHRQ